MGRIGLLGWAGAIAAAVALGGCAAAPTKPGSAQTSNSGQVPVAWLNRVTWGANASTEERASTLGASRYLEQQLHPGRTVLPPEAESQIASMTITRTGLEQLARDFEQRRKEFDRQGSDDARQAARQQYQQDLNRLAKEASTRFLLRALYSPNQLLEQMDWFWMNHFNVFAGKHHLRAAVGDYEEHAIRPHALGRFRDLLAATAHHPAMLVYLDNAQNAANRINENYARELMELHTLGVDGGYTQRDVQELARILTGVGIDLRGETPKVRRGLQSQYVRNGLFEFNPNRHDYGDKQFLGHTIHGSGLHELDEALDLLARHPATARHISRKLAVYFVADEPPASLVDAMAQTFRQTDGDITAVLRTMFNSPEFARSLGHKFKDPAHYAISAVRLAYDGKPILNANPLVNWLHRMGEPLYGHQTPDGYPMIETAWASAGQMTTRFEIARAIGSGAAGLFKTEGERPLERPAFPQLANSLYYDAIRKTLSKSTRDALDQAASPQEWNTFLLSSPEMMYR
jgi:uncharacterized protein (DUF1800 family)